MFDEQKIKLRPIERIGALIDTDKFKEDIAVFQRFEVNKGNAAFFRQLVNARKENNLNFMNDKLERMYRVLKAHPSFARFFKKPLEPDQKRRDPLDDMRPYGMLRGELIDDLGSIIEELGGLVAMLWNYVELDNILSTKLEQVIVKGESKPDESYMKAGRAVMPWGSAKSDRAYIMANIEDPPKTQIEIAQTLGIEVKQVSQYIKIGHERAVRLKVIDDTNHLTNLKEAVEEA